MYRDALDQFVWKSNSVDSYVGFELPSQTVGYACNPHLSDTSPPQIDANLEETGLQSKVQPVYSANMAILTQCLEVCDDVLFGLSWPDDFLDL